MIRPSRIHLNDWRVWLRQTSPALTINICCQYIMQVWVINSGGLLMWNEALTLWATAGQCCIIFPDLSVDLNRTVLNDTSLCPSYLYWVLPTSWRTKCCPLYYWQASTVHSEVGCILLKLESAVMYQIVPSWWGGIFILCIHLTKRTQQNFDTTCTFLWVS